MGYNTTVFILNDQLDRIRKDPQRFVEDLYRETQSHKGRPVLGQTTVMPTAHADQFRLYATQGNSIEELSVYSAETMRLIEGKTFQRAVIMRFVEQAESQLKELREAIKKVEAGQDGPRFTRLSLSDESAVKKLTGSHVMGYLNVSYADLICALGEPGGNSDPYKQDAEWLLEFPDGTVATVYNYKDGRAYLGDEGKPVEEITDWHVGGHSDAALLLVTELVQNLHSEG